jgi:hypothetical protein
MYTYAFLSSFSPPLDLPPGIADAPILFREAEIAALVEPELDLNSIQQNDERLIQAVLCHDRIIRAAFEQTTVLPLRFGTCFVSPQGLREHLQTHQEDYQHKLLAFKGKAEYGLKLTASESTAGSETAISTEVKGKAYFLAKKQRYQILAEQQQQQQAELQQVIAAIALTYPDYVSVPSEGVERIYLLSDRQQESNLYQHLQAWQTQLTHWQLQIGEALPPYHFV